MPADDRTLVDFASKVLRLSARRLLKRVDLWSLDYPRSHRRNARKGVAVSGLTTDDLRKRILEHAARDVTIAEAARTEKAAELELLPSRLEADLAEVRAGHERRTEWTRRALDEIQAEENDARALLDETRRALGACPSCGGEPTPKATCCHWAWAEAGSDPATASEVSRG